MQMQSTFMVLVPMSSSDTCLSAMHAMVLTRVLPLHRLLRLVVNRWLSTFSCSCSGNATARRIAVSLFWIISRWNWLFTGATQTM